MNEILTFALLSLSFALGVKTYPESISDWKARTLWEKQSDAYVFKASSDTFIDMCEKFPDYFIQLPQVIHAVHEVSIDDNLIFTTGDKTFKKASSFYDHPYLSCRVIRSGILLNWTIYSYSRYFARFSKYPEITKSPNLGNVFDSNFNIIAAGTLLVLCIISYYLFLKRIEKDIVVGLILGAFFFAIYFIMAESSKFNIPLTMLQAHKFADLALFIGIYFYFKVFNKYGFLTEKNLGLYRTFSLVGIIIITTGQTGDIIQFGTSLNLIIGFYILLVSFYSSFKIALLNHKNKIAWYSSASLFMIVATSTLDFLHIFGLTDTYMITSFGLISAIFLLALSTNEQIESTYKERDSLLISLESKVEEKTKDLNNALADLKNSQAELIQSAKLASLGTLSAGIAHEINNSINYVNGAIVPLEKKVLKHIPDTEKESIGKLFKVVKQGTDLTVQIVRSLRNFTGLNQSAFRDINVEEIVTSVLTILKSKLSQIKLTVDIEKDLKFEGSQVGVSQAIMNLITNAIDVLPANNPEIIIKAYSKDEYVEIAITDNGSGIPEEIKTRIFDPFFTTKQVGKGTGLGLYIVKKEMDRHNGTILINSEMGVGTTFLLIFKKINKAMETKVSLEAA